MFERVAEWIVGHAFTVNLWLGIFMAFLVQLYVQRRKNPNARMFDRLLSGVICSLLTIAVILPVDIDPNLFMFVGVIVGAMGVEVFLQLAVKIGDSILHSKLLAALDRPNVRQVYEEIDQCAEIPRPPRQPLKRKMSGKGKPEPPMPGDFEQ